MTAATVERLRAGFASGRTRPLEWRRTQLQALARMLRTHEAELAGALARDLGKPAPEAYATEIGFTLGEVRHALANLKRWTRPRRVAIPLALQPASARTTPQPQGVVLILAPWNYPLQLLLVPLCGALAAGNCAVLKPSELAPFTSALLATLLPRYLDTDAVAVVEGGTRTAGELLGQRFDHYFFTGSAGVGRQVMEAAARVPAPATLELGGKCPAIVHDGDLRTIARRIAFAKFTNAGQTCVAPDHVLVLREHAPELARQLRGAILEFFGADPAQSRDYGKIVNERHHRRLADALAEALDGGATVLSGGRHDARRRYFEPTVLVDAPSDSALAREEIFGPVLPLVVVQDLDDALERARQHQPPLAAYVFTRDPAVRARVEAGLRAGAIAVNACAVHLAAPGLPFGGIGASGLGRYHGRHSFEAFSQARPVFRKPLWPDTLRMAYPPYGGWRDRVLRWLLR
ncbi:aldehyde dehydrogenase family protein [Lysobacter sp. GX 14042]|uniref:aldehyde dehydrogenase family protein n=1 Tax=Lysobacter sp. GX 14042 TaxID=2907155 RepID=UPI001F27C945|nr:aldehyde dehydrogenase family protein [Lysobacter sp. GX 14042]MCE7031580.1 aldehyde dehydrogenase family protein [Lysobacter sp. GX 14042]